MKSELAPQAILCSYADVAALLKISTRSVSYLVSSGRLKRRKYGRAVRIPLTEVMRVSRMDLGRIRPVSAGEVTHA